MKRAPFRCSPFPPAPPLGNKLRPGEFSLDVEVGPTAARIAVGGEIDLATADALQSALDKALDQRPPCVVIDAWQLTFVDLQGLRVLERLARRTREAGGQVVLVGASPLLRRLLHLTKSSRLFDLQPAATAAVMHA